MRGRDILKISLKISEKLCKLYFPFKSSKKKKELKGQLGWTVGAVAGLLHLSSKDTCPWCPKNMVVADSTSDWAVHTALQTYSFPPTLPWRFSGRWCVFWGRQQSSSSRAGCHSVRHWRSTGCHQCPWRPCHPVQCAGDLEKNTKICSEMWTSATNLLVTVQFRRTWQTVVHSRDTV